MAIFDGLLYLDNSWGEILAAHPLVNSESCHARILNWAIRENIQPEELAQYGEILYWARSTGHMFSRIAQWRTLAWQLLRLTRKYTLSNRIYYSIALKYSIVRWLRMWNYICSHQLLCFKGVPTQYFWSGREFFLVYIRNCLSTKTCIIDNSINLDTSYTILKLLTLYQVNIC